MKIRTSFVSNSSTTSFIICGFNCNKESLLKLYEKVTGKNLSEDDDFDVYDISHEIASNIGDGFVAETSDYIYTESVLLGYGDNIGDACNSISPEEMILNVEKTKELKEKYELEEDFTIWYGATVDY